MVHTEIQIKEGKKYYYRTLSIRNKNKFSKLRKYLGKELSKKTLREKEVWADNEIRQELGKLRKMKIGERKLYKQSGAGLGLTIGLPMYWIMNPTEMEKGLKIVYKGDMTYVTPDLQFWHYFLSEELLPAAKEIFSRMEKDKNWMKKRINEFNSATKGFEDLGERLIQAGENFNRKNSQETIEIYESFLKADYNYWTPSIFIDLFDNFEKEIIDFVFKEKSKIIEKEDLRFLLLPEKSIFWKEKEDFEKIRVLVRKKGLDRASKELWIELQKHAKKYWWINNDYQSVQKLGASNFIQKLDERLEQPFWDTLVEKKQALFKKYDLDNNTLNRLSQFVDMAYLRDIRKQYTQIANYYIVTFFQSIAKKLNVPTELINHIIPYIEYKRFIKKNTKLLKELEVRKTNGVWMIGPDFDWKHNIETEKAKEILKLVEQHLRGASILYGSAASLGKGYGQAKVVLRQADFHKFREGDILLTGMTRPEFVPLMKKASAIVTDEGGITCHAAIISRELNKPCIVGTQTATKAFKDGDFLEVNADHGYVKIIESAE